MFWALGLFPRSLPNSPHFLVEQSENEGKAQVENTDQDFPGGPVVKTLPSNAGGAGSIPGQGAKTTP